MNVFKRKIYRKKLYSYLTTFAVIMLLMLTGPANALNVDIPDLPSTITTGQVITFTIAVDILNGEHIPLKYSELIFTNPSNTADTCRILNTGSISSVPTCPYNLQVSITQSNNLGYGYGYGYGYNTPPYGYGYNFGYGYGYSPTGNQPGKVTYHVTWNTAGIVTGAYKIKAAVHAGTNSVTWFSSEKSITVNSATTSSGGGSGGGGINTNRGGGLSTTATNPPVPGPLPAPGPRGGGETPTVGTEEATTTTTPGLQGGIGAAIANIFSKAPVAISVGVIAFVTLVLSIVYVKIFRRRRQESQ